MQAIAKSVKTVCPYCGVGCGMVLRVENGRVTKVSGDKDHPSNFGRLCTKGVTSAQALSNSGRMEQAFIRQARKDDQVPVPTRTAITRTAQRLRTILDQHGPDSLAFYVSGQMSLEAQYLINKLAKGYVKTNNIDSNSRLCMSSAASGYKLSLGADGPPGSYQDFDKADVFFVAGANMADCHPILFLRLMDRRKAGAKLIVVDPRRNATADKADLFLQINPGTDLALLNGLLHLLVVNGHIDPAFIDEFTEGWEAMPSFLQAYTPAAVSETTGIPEADIRTAAQWIGEAGDWMSCWTMGLNQSTHGTWHTNAICNLHLATGAICRPGSGPFSLTGQPNAMGGREVGYLSHGLPGQRTVADEGDRQFIETLWQVPPGTIRPQPGPDTISMFKSMQDGSIKAVWIICTNPVATVPNRKNVIEGLKAAELVICQDAYLDTETNIYADILLPGALWAEAQGVMINSERNLTLMNKAVDPPGDALPDWQIIAMVACEMGYADAFSYASAAKVFDEIRQTWNPKTGYDIRGASHQRLGETPLQWPCPPEDEIGRNPTRYLNNGASQSRKSHDNGEIPRLSFPTKTGKAHFFARPFMPPAELPDSDFPFILNTGRLPHQWHTLTKTGKIQPLNKLNPGPFIEIHPEDAQALSIADTDIVELTSRRGKARLPATVTDRVLPGSCFTPFHWNDIFGDDLAINAVTNDAVDAISLQPEFKYCAIALSRIGPAPVTEASDTAPQPSSRALPSCHASTSGSNANIDAFVGALDLEHVPKPAFNALETLYLSGFVGGLRALENVTGLPGIPPNAPFSPASRLWVEGLLAGLFSRADNGALNDQPGATPASPAQKTVTVLWASQTGNAEALAGQFADGLAKSGFKSQAIGMGDFAIDRLSSEQTIVLVTSTYGDGDPPDNGRDFWDVLNSDKAPRLDHLTYSVCALGDPSYDQFCQHGKNLDRRLAELGAKRLVDRANCDTDFDLNAQTWLDSLVQHVGAPSAATVPADAKPEAPHTKAHPYAARLIGNVRLNSADSEKDTRSLALSLEGSSLSYEAGDALGVWPHNCPELVDEVLQATGLAGDATINVAGLGETSLRQALGQNYELTKPNREMLSLIAEFSGSQDIKAMLENENKDVLKSWLWGKQTVDILHAFPITPSVTDFLASLKRMQPRLYSISSSPKAHAGEVHLTVSAVRFGNKARKGACSTFLADRSRDNAVPVFVQPSSHFRLPADTAVPIIMIGPGTGVAPFRGFLHERRITGSKGKNWLFFGEQRAATDFYYRAEIESLRRDGVLTELSLAFSRDQAEKVYVQHKMIERGADLWAWLEEGAQIYICGDASRMAKDVEAALLTIIAQHGARDEDGARAYLNALSRDKRYLRDVY